MVVVVVVHSRIESLQVLSTLDLRLWTLDLDLDCDKKSKVNCSTDVASVADGHTYIWTFRAKNICLLYGRYSGTTTVQCQQTMCCGHPWVWRPGHHLGQVSAGWVRAGVSADHQWG